MRQKLGHALVKLGPPAAEALLRRFAAASNPERAALVQFLDAVSVDQPLPPETLNRIAGLLLESLKLADIRLRAEILNTRIFAHPQLSPEFRRSAAQALLPLLRGADHPESSGPRGGAAGGARRGRGGRAARPRAQAPGRAGGGSGAALARADPRGAPARAASRSRRTNSSRAESPRRRPRRAARRRRSA